MIQFNCLLSTCYTSGIIAISKIQEIAISVKTFRGLYFEYLRKYIENEGLNQNHLLWRYLQNITGRMNGDRQQLCQLRKERNSRKMQL